MGEIPCAVQTFQSGCLYIGEIFTKPDKGVVTLF